MKSGWLGGVAVGIGIGWLNATALGIPGWANIVIMTVVAMVAAVDSKVAR